MILFAFLFVVLPAFIVGLFTDPAWAIFTVIALEILLMKVPMRMPTQPEPIDLDDLLHLAEDHPEEPEPDVMLCKAALPSRDTNWLEPEHPHRI